MVRASVWDKTRRYHDRGYKSKPKKTGKNRQQLFEQEPKLHRDPDQEPIFITVPSRLIWFTQDAVLKCPDCSCYLLTYHRIRLYANGVHREEMECYLCKFRFCI